ncbi:uncharacterized protein METZ01_LOCUS359441, partial [marine metagenome]
MAIWPIHGRLRRPVNRGYPLGDKRLVAD